METPPEPDQPTTANEVGTPPKSKSSMKTPKAPKKTLKRKKEESSDEDSGSDLEDFIVKDKRYRKMKGEEIPSDSEEEEVASEGPALPEDGPELAKVLQEEAEQIAKNLKSQVVGGRALRDRSAIKKPQDSYWEKYGKAD